MKYPFPLLRYQFIILLIIALSPIISTAATLRIGLIQPESSVFKQGTIPAILSDQIQLMFTAPQQSESYQFGSTELALKALNDRKIDLIITPKLPVNTLHASIPLLRLSLAEVQTRGNTGGTLCSPEISKDMMVACNKYGSTSLTGNIQRLIRGEYHRFIAPEYLLKTWFIHAPVTTFTFTPLQNIAPVHYYAWALPDRQDIIADINTHILSLSSKDARWLEQKWFLPAGSVYSADDLPASRSGSKTQIQVLLPLSPPPFVQITKSGQIHGVWHDLLMHLFPANRFDLSFTQSPDINAPPPQGHQIQLRIIASNISPSTEALAFDSLSWGLVSPTYHPLTGDLQKLQNTRIAVKRTSAINSLLHKCIPAKNLLPVSNLEEGIELVKTGGADGLAGDAFSLHTLLKQTNSPSLQLTPLSIPDTTLWFSVNSKNKEELARVRSILKSVTPGDIYTHRVQLKSGVPVSPPPSEGSSWPLLLSPLLICVILTVAFAYFYACAQRRQREQDTSALTNTLSLWQTLLNSAPVPLFICDVAGRLIRFNEAFEQSQQWDRILKEGAFIGRLPLNELALQFRLPQRLALLNTESPITGEAILRHNVTIYWWLCSYTDKYQKPCGIVGGWVDISEKAALTLALHKELSKAEHASMEKSNFLARMSHDIRTPLNAVLGLLEMEQSKSKSLNIAWQAAVTLQDLIGETLDLSRIEAGQLQLDLRWHNLYDVLNTNANIFCSYAATKNLDWRCTLEILPESQFFLDKIRLNQIIANLLGNAIKYTAHGEIGFTVYYQHNHLFISITDTGIGIPPDARAHLGKPWFQINPAAQQGSGLGLAICYQLVGLMKGTISIDSQPGTGTQVLVKLPLEQQTSDKDFSNNGDVQHPVLLPNLRVLVVDDLHVNLSVMTLQLEKMGLNTVCCSGAQMALEIMKKEQFDILIADCQMPEINGFEFVRKLLFLDLYGQVCAPPLIVGSTACALPEEEQRAIHAGMDCLLRKPITTQRLNDIVSQFCKSISQDGPDFSEIKRLSDSRPEIMISMLQQIYEVIAQDIHQVRGTKPSLAAIGTIAHRLKSSWSLVGMQSAVRGCLVLETLAEPSPPELLNEDEIATLLARFVISMQSHLETLERYRQNYLTSTKEST